MLYVSQLCKPPRPVAGIAVSNSKTEQSTGSDVEEAIVANVGHYLLICIETNLSVDRRVVTPRRPECKSETLPL
jgi:hypothetical protein